MDLIAAVATPAGVGALGVVRLSGDACRAAAAKLLGGKTPEPRRATRAEALDAAGAPVDDVVAVFYPADSSPTGEDLLELSAHGSPLILKRLLEAALAAGARPARPEGEFTQRAYVNGRLDLAQAEAVCDLIRARTDAARRAALTQLKGGLSREVAAIREPLFELLVRVEASLDHPEEELPGAPKDAALAVAAAAKNKISALADSFSLGRLVAEGARVCIVGRPNAGKSSLLNALLGRERAIVCAEPGTTRDTLEESATLSGAPAVLIDTAGFRERCVDAAEKIGLERAETALENADLALLVVDGSRPEDQEDGRVHARIRAAAAARGRPLIPVVNKADALASCWEGQPGLLRVSATERTGLAALSQAVAAALGREGGPADEAALVTSARHFDALTRARAALTGVESLGERWEDRFARDLREAISALGEIDGATTTEELLGAVFSKFCVGK